MFTLELPCGVGATVYADIEDNRDGDFLDECIVSEIRISRDYSEPLFTVICYEKAEFQRYWASDFGKEVFFEPRFASDKQKEV